MKSCCLVLGSYLNAYTIVRELHKFEISDIVLAFTKKMLAAYSRYPHKKILFKRNTESLKKIIFDLKKTYEKIIIYATDDHHLEMLNEIFDEIESFCYLPFNPSHLNKCLDKNYQYFMCEKLNIPYPKTTKICKTSDLNSLNIEFPIIIKPTIRLDIHQNIFRNLYIENSSDFKKHQSQLETYLNDGAQFLASECIPGDGDNIYAYIGYRNHSEKILNEWSGKKLSQYPNDFGVFSSASNEYNDEVTHQGRKLLEGLNLYGFCEPEFKYDDRDGKFKLMEINLRPMMWHRVGNLAGVFIHETQWRDALGLQIKKYSQSKDHKIHMPYMKHEILNFLFRKKYKKIFFSILFSQNKVRFPVWNYKDPMPFIFDTYILFKGIVYRCLKKFTKKSGTRSI